MANRKTAKKKRLKEQKRLALIELTKQKIKNDLKL
jgi:hypothetical protein